jgi:cytoskeletal protein CcmA (bactofilin family)
VAIDGTVTGDVIALVREVSVRGTVKGNVIAFARTVNVEGIVEGSVLGFAQSLRTQAHVAHNVYGFGQTVEIGRDARIEGNATLLAAESDIEGSIGKDAFARAGSVNIGPAVHIGRNFSARTGRRDNVRIAPQATIGGVTDIRISQPAPSRYSTLSFYVWQTIWLAAAFLTGLLLFWIFPSLTYTGFETMRALLVTAGAGFIALVAPPVAAVIGAITLIGLPLGLMALACWVAAIYISKVVVAGFVGRSLLARGGDTQPATALMLLAGLVPIFIAINLPYLGPLVNLLLVILGLGLIVVRIYGGPRRHPAQAQAA